MRNLKKYTENTLLDFGKYKGISIIDVVRKDANYLAWCIENVTWFTLDEVTLEMIFESYHKNQIIQAFLNNRVKPRFEESAAYLKDFNSKKLELIETKKYTKINKKGMIHGNKKYIDWDNPYHNSYNWLADAAGTNDPEVMNDVFWNID